MTPHPQLECLYSILLTFTTFLSVSFICFSSLSLLLFFLFSQNFGRNPGVHSHVSLFQSTPKCLCSLLAFCPWDPFLLSQHPYFWQSLLRIRFPLAGADTLLEPDASEDSCLFVVANHGCHLLPAEYPPGWRRTAWRRAVNTCFHLGQDTLVVLISLVVPSGMRRGGTGPSSAHSYPLGGWWLATGLFLPWVGLSSSWVTSLNIVAEHQSYSAGRLCLLVEVSKCLKQLSRTREAMGWHRG